jgi:hypothetical protein
MTRRSTAIAAFLALATHTLLAQEPADTLPFRAHQWGFLFTGGSSFAGLGALKLTAPNRAWIFNVGGSAVHSRNDVPFSPDTTDTHTQTAESFSLRLGRRFYQARGHEVVSYQTVGISGGVSRFCSHDSLAGLNNSDCSTGWLAGVFGELGAQYLLTPRLSIGGQFTAGVTYQFSRDSNALPSRIWSVELSFGQVGFGGAIYF